MRQLNFTHYVVVALLFFMSPFVAKSQINKDSLVHIMESTTVDSIKVKLLIQLANLNELSDLKKSFEFVNEAIEIAKKNNLQNELLEAYKAAGKICFDLGLMEDAAIYFNHCLELIYKKGNTLEMAKANLNVGAIWLFMENYEKAEAYHLKSLQLLKDYSKARKEKELPVYVINVYNNLGLIYKNIGKIPKALFFNEMGIKLAENNPDYAQTFVFLLHINGDLLIRQSKFKEADSVLHKAIVVAEKLNFVGGLTPSYELLGEMSTKQGNKEAALNNYKKGYESAVASGSIDLVQKIANKLQLIYKDLGNTDSAFKYLNISIDTQKKIKIEEAKEELVNKENKRKFEEWQKESDRQHVRSSLLYWIIASVSLLIAIVVFVFYLKKRKQHKLMLLEKIEKDLAFQHLELEKTLLESTLENKEKQLTSDILYQIQKNEMIEDVVKKLLNQTKQSTEVNKEVIQEAINNLSQTQESNVWNEFETRFKKVHIDFYDNLQVKYPELSRNDRRLCAFLRLNMTTKEISAISGQSLKSIDVARSRLRKKLGIANAETGLVEFMSTI